MTSTVKASDTARSSVEITEPRVRLEFLDGVRGFASLYVVQVHLLLDKNVLPLWLNRLLGHGTVFVAVFIVLSGYCLMLPVARSSRGELRGGILNYLKRRARRILPPYYAALVFTIAIVLLERFLTRAPLLIHPLSADSVLAPVNLLLHVTLLHNLSPVWRQTIDPPMWSVAPEWQIYFLFPLVLLPLWKRFGMLLPLLSALAIGMLPHLLLPADRNGDYLYIWYIALFTIGMMGAVVSFSTLSYVTRLRERVPWFLLTGVLGALLIVLALTDHLELVWEDFLVSAFTCALLIYCARQSSIAKGYRPSLLLRFLESRVLVGIGVFSYSLYLIHMPARWMMQPVMRKLHLAGIPALMYELCVMIPFAVFVSYLFHLAVERRFMPGHPRTTREAAQAAEISPAP